MEIERITSGAALDDLLATARSEGRCALDTEFVWERTYAPRLCLAQIATAERVAVVDPLEGASLEPVAALVADPAVTCVIPATGNPDHMQDDLKAGYGRLPDDGQRRRIRELWDSL